MNSTKYYNSNTFRFLAFRMIVGYLISLVVSYHSPAGIDFGTIIGSIFLAPLFGIIIPMLLSIILLWIFPKSQFAANSFDWHPFQSKTTRIENRATTNDNSIPDNNKDCVTLPAVIKTNTENTVNSLASINTSNLEIRNNNEDITDAAIEETLSSVLDSVIGSPLVSEEYDEHLELDGTPEVEGSYDKDVELEAGRATIKTKIRSKQNRDLALHIHGRNCIVCKFNFDNVYGPEISDGFIHIHHTKPIAVNALYTPNILTDLVPVCANCHAMIHRKKKEITIRELRNAIIAHKQQ